MKLIKEEKLLFGLPIKMKNLGTIYQPTLSDFFNNNIDIQNFIGLFNIKIDTLVEDNEKLKDFDFFLLQMTQGEKGSLLIYQLMKYLKLLYKADNVKFIEMKDKDLSSVGISIEVNKDEKYFINRDNYSKLAEVVSIILGNGNNIKEKEVKEELNEIDLKIAKRRKEFEKKKAEREAKLRKENAENNKNNALTILDLVNYIIHTDNTQYNYNNILDLTVYQVINTFKLYQVKESYKINMDYRTSGNFKIEDSIEHWFFKKD